jgi:hypothetical protein
MQDIPDLKPQSKTSFPYISYSKWISIVIAPHMGLLHIPTSHSINIFIPIILALPVRTTLKSNLMRKKIIHFNSFIHRQAGRQAGRQMDSSLVSFFLIISNHHIIIPDLPQ